MKIGYHYASETPQYDNCEVLSPDGQLMFRCCRKKAFWYLDRNLGIKVKDNPLTIKLAFVPKGIGRIDDPYFLQKMENRCVVCGNKESLTRHHIVPICYRRYFPVKLKSHYSYDVMPLCIPCHSYYEECAIKFKYTLAEKYSAPIGGKGITFNRELAKIKGAASALTNYKDRIPPERQKFLLELIKDYFKREVNEIDIKDLAEKNLYNFDNYVEHGKIVIEQIQDIDSFIIDWRKHFLNIMQPKYLPAHWDINRSGKLQ